MVLSRAILWLMVDYFHENAQTIKMDIVVVSLSPYLDSNSRGKVLVKSGITWQMQSLEVFSFSQNMALFKFNNLRAWNFFIEKMVWKKMCIGKHWKIIHTYSIGFLKEISLRFFFAKSCQKVNFKYGKSLEFSHSKPWKI